MLEVGDQVEYVSAGRRLRLRQHRVLAATVTRVRDDQGAVDLILCTGRRVLCVEPSNGVHGWQLPQLPPQSNKQAGVTA